MRMKICINFFFNDTATTEIYTLSLHDALPICSTVSWADAMPENLIPEISTEVPSSTKQRNRSEEHTSELQSQSNIVCRLLLEKKYHLLHRSRAVATLQAPVPRNYAGSLERLTR